MLEICDRCSAGRQVTLILPALFHIFFWRCDLGHGCPPRCGPRAPCSRRTASAPVPRCAWASRSRGEGGGGLPALARHALHAISPLPMFVVCRSPSSLEGSIDAASASSTRRVLPLQSMSSARGFRDGSRNSECPDDTSRRHVLGPRSSTAVYEALQSGG